MDNLLLSSETLFHEGDAYFSSLNQDILLAKQSIRIESYIFDQDEIGNKILQSLLLAHQNGVKITLMLDGIGASSWNYREAELWKAKGIQILFFHPLPWQKSWIHIWNTLGIQKIIIGLSKFNQRNHRKLAIIDDFILYTGSRNISQRHSEKHFQKKCWRDTSVRISGPFVNEYKKKLRKNRLFHHAHYQEIIRKLQEAKKRIYITTPYFIPNRMLFKTLLKAAQNGVDIQLLVPHQSDASSVKYAMEFYYSHLLKNKIRIYEYRPCMMHAKILIIDDEVTLGSSNLDYRSLFHDLEFDLKIEKEENTKLLLNQFREDLKNSREINLIEWKNRNWLQKTLEKIFIIFRTLF